MADQSSGQVIYNNPGHRQRSLKRQALEQSLARRSSQGGYLGMVKPRFYLTQPFGASFKLSQKFNPSEPPSIPRGPIGVEI